MTRVARPYVSNALPRDARDALVAAAATDPHRPVMGSQERRRQVEDAIKRIKSQYPQLFIKE